jgi:hypothetical protein
MNAEEENNLLKQKIEGLENQVAELEEHLKKYTNSTRHIKYYENNSEKVKERTKNYVEKLKTENPEKLKEWRRTYYLKKKEKLKEQQQTSDTTI